MASAVPSFVHGCVTSVMAAVLACRHIRDDGALLPTAANTAADVLVLQFSCVRVPLATQPWKFVGSRCQCTALMQG